MENHTPKTIQELIDLRVPKLTQSTHDREVAIENLKSRRLSNKVWFDKYRRLRPETMVINIRDLVLLYDSKLDNQHTNKLADKWAGPYIVLKILDGGTYVLTKLDEAKLDGTYAGNRLKKYWQRATQKEGNAIPKEDLIGNEKGNENGKNATQKEENDSGEK